MKCTSSISSITPRDRSSRSVANLRRGSVISMWRPVISTLIGDPPPTREASGPEATLVCARNFQIFAILRDAATRYRNAFFLEHLGNLFVGKRISRILILDKSLD